MSKRSDLLLLEDILNSIRKIEIYIGSQSFEEFDTDEKTKDAVIRNFEIIGEASARISENLKASSDEIPWPKLKSFRNRIAHEYIGIDYEIVWHLIKHELPKLAAQLNSVQNKISGIF